MDDTEIGKLIKEYKELLKENKYLCPTNRYQKYILLKNLSRIDQILKELDKDAEKF
jgi:hypothetical protein